MPIPIPIVMPLAFVRVIPGMIFVPAFLTGISQIASALLGLLAALTMAANGLFEIGFRLLNISLTLCSILGVRRLNRYRSNQDNRQRCR